VSGLAAAWGRLSREQHQAALAAVGLVVALFLPWYEKSLFQATGRGKLISATSNLSAFQVISWVEAAVMLVAVGVLFLLWARSQEKGFHLPGGDGTVILAAGCWAALLLIWRLFDKPDVAGAGATVGIQWGWFVALVMAVLLAAAGLRMRAAHRPEPPNPAEDLEWDEAPPRRPPATAQTAVQPRPPRARSTAVTEPFGERPDWEGEPPEHPGRAAPPER
jgi:hypothetical protein